METSQTFTNIAAALAAAQGGFTPIEKNRQAVIPMKSGGRYTFRYADLAAILAAVTPALSKNGIAILQPVETADNRVTVRTWLVHASGEFFRSDPISLVAAEHDPKQLASLITYLRRYQVSSMLAVAADDDVDAEGEPEEPIRTAPPPAGSGRFTCAHGHKHDTAEQAKTCAKQEQASPPDQTLEPGQDPPAMDGPTPDDLLASVKRALAEKDWRAAMGDISLLPRGSPARKQAEALYTAARSAK